MLGLSSKGNNWKLVVANFLVMFMVQMAFPINDILNSGIYPEIFDIVKIASNSLVTTLIFYGFNRARAKEE